MAGRTWVRGPRRLSMVAALAASAALLPPPGSATVQQSPSTLPHTFVRIASGPAGGSLWQGRIPDPALPALRRPSVVYLPAGMRTGARYPVIYLLHGFRGSPWQFSSGLRIAAAADRSIATRRVRPFIAVAPPAGLTSAYDGEWAGPWETYLVRDVVPWVDTHLPAARSRSERAIAGLSAGGFGAVDIGLRHPRLFETLEAWSGYFRPLRDGPFRHLDARGLADHDPYLLVVREAPLLRRLGTRFYLSCGTDDRRTAALAVGFSAELARLRLPHRLDLAPGGHDGRFWRSQLPDALRYAVPPPA